MAYTSNEVLIGTFTAAANYASSQNLAVAQTAAAQTVTLASVQGQRIMGVLTNDPASGAQAIVQTAGEAKIVAGGTIAAGDLCIVSSAGKALSAANNDGWIIGRAVLGGAADETITIDLSEGGRMRSAIVYALPIALAGVTAADVATAITPGFAGHILSTQFIVTTVVTTGSKAATLNLEIGTTDCTGGTVALTSANCTPLGARVAGAAITAGYTFGRTDTISVEASSVTAFSEGAGVLYITVVQD